jgi:predicted Zn-dependent protease
VLKQDWENGALWGEKYVLLVPSDAKGWQVLARCYSELGEDDKALEATTRYSTLKGGGGQ